MEEGPFASRYFVVERILDHLDTDELFTCAEVNRLWQSVALSLLRRKLVSVSVCCVQDSEQAVPVSALGSSHVCVDIFCSKFSRLRNIARMAGLRPSLVFLSYHADLSDDRRAVERLREFLPLDSVIVYFKLELARRLCDSGDPTHEGIFGEFLFRDDEDESPDAPPTSHQEPDDQQRSLSDLAIPGPSRLPSIPNAVSSRRRSRGTQSVPPQDLAVALPSTSIAGAPPPRRPPRPRLSSAAGSEPGASFRNVLPGVLVFQALHVSTANREGNNTVTTYFTEEATGKTVQVVSAAVFSIMPRSQLDPFMRRLSDELGSTDNTIALAFPRKQDESLAELDAFERCFHSVPTLANQASEFHVDGQFAPMSRLKLILLLIKLLD